MILEAMLTSRLLCKYVVIAIAVRDHLTDNEVALKTESAIRSYRNAGKEAS